MKSMKLKSKKASKYKEKKNKNPREINEGMCIRRMPATLHFSI